MSLAEQTRRAARDHPFLQAALGAGVVNYTAAARFLDVDGETDAVATALRRYAAELDAPAAPGEVRVSMESGLAPVDPGDGDALLVVGDRGFAPDGGSLTAILARGDVGPDALRRALARLGIEDVPVRAAGVGNALVVVVERRAGADAVRAVEAALDA